MRKLFTCTLFLATALTFFGCTNNEADGDAATDLDGGGSSDDAGAKNDAAENQNGEDGGGDLDAAQLDAGDAISEAEADAEADATVADSSLPDAQCPVIATCDDEVMNGNESDEDCGGNCMPCLAAQSCTANSDCASLHCTGGACAALPASCSNTTRDNDESGVDCGGANCLPCEAGFVCVIGADCTSARCEYIPPSGGRPATNLCSFKGSLTAQVVGNGSVSSDDGKLSCSNSCTAQYSPSRINGQTVTLTAHASGDAKFAGWFDVTGPAPCASGGSPQECTLTLYGGTASVTAYFTRDGEGTTRYDRSFGGGSGRVNLTSSDLRLDGSAVIAGTFSGTTDLGGGPVTATGNQGFVSAFDPSGINLWTRKLGESAEVKVAPTGVSALIKVNTASSVGGSVLSCPQGASGRSLILARFGQSDGAHVWSRCLPAHFAIHEVDSAGDVLVLGELRNVADFGGGGVAVPAGKSLLFAAKLAGADGSYLWLDAIATTPLLASSVSFEPVAAVAPNRDLIIVTRSDMEVDFTATDLPNIAAHTAFFGRLSSSDGAVRYVKSVPASMDSIGQTAAVSDDDTIVLGGSFRGSLTLGCTRIVESTAGGRFIAGLNGSDGHPRWLLPTGGSVGAGQDIVYASSNGRSLRVVKLSAAGTKLWEKVDPSYNDNMFVTQRGGEILVTTQLNSTTNRRIWRVGP